MESCPKGRAKFRVFYDWRWLRRSLPLSSAAMATAESGSLRRRGTVSFLQAADQSDRMTEAPAPLATPMPPATCKSGPLAPGDGTQDLEVIGPCMVSGGSYQYKKVNICRPRVSREPG
jgi:hypothetical protein